MRCSPRNLKAEAARVLPPAEPVLEPVRLFPLSRVLVAPLRVQVPGAVRLPQVAQRAAEAAAAAAVPVAVTPEVAGVAGETSRCSREPTSPKPCRASCRR